MKSFNEETQSTQRTAEKEAKVIFSPSPRSAFSASLRLCVSALKVSLFFEVRSYKKIIK